MNTDRLLKDSIVLISISILVSILLLIYLAYGGASITNFITYCVLGVVLIIGLAVVIVGLISSLIERYE